MQILHLIRSLSVLIVACGFARADVFRLADGGEVTGQLIEKTANGDYQIKTPQGALLTFAKQQVAEVVRQSPLQQEYEKRSRALPDSVAAHRAMADWCKQQKLDDLAAHHLKRIVAIDPQDEKARANLGYQEHHGRWLTRDEIMAERGMTFYGGTYRTAQDIALRERAKAQKTAEVEWIRQLKQWRNWLDSRRAEEAQAKINAVTDPLAASAAIQMLNSERDDDLRLMWIRILSQIHHPATMRKLIQLSVAEPSRDMRLQCLEYLTAMGQEIDIEPYVKALGNKDNETVNVAAEALGYIGDPEAISPLIDALVTRHKVPAPQTGNMSASFSPDGGGGTGLSAGNKPQFVIEDIQNIAVLQALVKLSGDQDHGFNQTAWRRWFVNQQIQHDYVDPRRDQ